MNEELRYSIDREVAWNHHWNTLDRGSYCEDPSHESTVVSRIVAAYRELGDALLIHARNAHWKRPIEHARISPAH